VRVELPGSTPSPEPVALTLAVTATVAEPPPAAAAAPTQTLTRRPTTRSERIVNTMTQWRVAGPLLGISVALLAWSLIIRQPESARLLKVSARAKALSDDPATNNAALTAEHVAALRQEAKNLSTALTNHRKEVLPLLAPLEARARELGWYAERSMKAAQPSPSGQTNLTLHPVFLRLTPAAGHRSLSYLRLLEWLNTITTFEKRTEVVSVHLQADGSGLSSAEIKLHFFSTPAHEETAAK